uniref:Uncharacterized protein n=1 Tax=Knipowitschia caucasica TaxID=637954 RepID=A0AAV2MAM3_KNICA
MHLFVCRVSIGWLTSHSTNQREASTHQVSPFPVAALPRLNIHQITISVQCLEGFTGGRQLMMSKSPRPPLHQRRSTSHPPLPRISSSSPVVWISDLGQSQRLPWRLLRSTCVSPATKSLTLWKKYLNTS